MAHHRREIPLRGYTLSLDDVARIYQRLSAYVAEEGARELGAFQRPANMTQEDFDRERERLRTHAFRITVTINGADGSSLYEDNAGIFTSPNLPADLSQIFMTNATAFEAATRIRPTNNFSLTIDFSKPPLIDGNNPVSSPTPNLTILVIEGVTDGWLATIADRVFGVLKSRKNKRDFLHRAFVYDAGVMLFGVPAGLYLCWKAAPHNKCAPHAWILLRRGVCVCYICCYVDIPNIVWIHKMGISYDGDRRGQSCISTASPLVVRDIGRACEHFDL